jgi:redox-sensitive bicupin YhaK (pirin superfamily)
MSAGTGILHSEKNDSVQFMTDPVHFVQMWVVPDTAGVTPGYEQLEIDDAAMRGKLATVASGMARHTDEAAIRIGNRDAALFAARLQPGEAVELPDAPYVHLFVPLGSVDLEGAGELAEGDSVRLTAAGARRVVAVSPAEILVWEMHASVG